MAAKKQSAGKTATASNNADRESIAVTEIAAPAPAASQPDEQMAREMNELKEMVASLITTVQDGQARSAHTAVIQNTANEIGRIARAIPAAAAYRPVAEPGAAKDDCGDCECGCIDTGCCCFEICLDKIRAIQPQLELADMGDTTVPLPTINELEVRLFAAIDGVGVLLPSLSTTMGLRVPSFLVGGGPGLWMPIGRVINRVFVKKGTTKTVTVDFQASEIDEGMERLVGWKDEHGMASGSITLDCCTARIYPPAPTDLSFDFGGTGGGIPGAISMAFSARRVCC